MHLIKALLTISIVFGYVSLSIAQSNRLNLTSININNDQIHIAWTNGFAPFKVQSRSFLSSGSWQDIGNETFGRAHSVNMDNSQGYFRIIGHDQADESAEYRLTFNSFWSSVTHPTNYPSGSAHYSCLVGGTHNSNVKFWEPGATSTSGIERMAESGSRSTLLNEVDVAINEGNADQGLSGPCLDDTPGSENMTFNIQQNFPLVTMVTMIAPSPDWFVGVRNLNLFIDGDWVDSITVTLFPYDAGSDSGMSYTTPNDNTAPKEPIHRLKGFPVEHNGEVAPFGEFVFTRIN